MCIREFIETRDERVLHKSRNSTATIITSGPNNSISSLTAKKSRRKRKKNTTTKIIIIIRVGGIMPRHYAFQVMCGFFHYCYTMHTRYYSLLFQQY
mmetsp:Transcript_21962/g.25414  ORF Transcript_21962/g.25414 Transcript_21962/m.25414 type:complete len:96 (+) Transcript_21962:249-536(+)